MYIKVSSLDGVIVGAAPRSSPALVTPLITRPQRKRATDI